MVLRSLCSKLTVCSQINIHKMVVKISKVLLLDNVDPSAKTILEENGIAATLSKEKFTTPELIKELQAYDGVVVRSATKMTAEIIENCPNLKIIGRAGVGVDNVDIKSATKNGVVVMNTPGGNTLSAAEHTCTLICCLSRNVPAADASMKAGKWDRKAFMGHELYGKTLGIIGLGRIGREAGIRMQSFGMKTIGFDPLVSKEEAAKYNIEWMKTDEIWPEADYITVHTPLIPQTKGLLNDASFAKCKKGVRVINCARGGIIDEDALLRALQSGQCGGAGLDVYVEEPATNMPLVQHAKVVACPHLGASTKEGQARCGKEVAEQFVNVAKGTDFFGVLNAPALTHANGIEDWITLATQLGKVAKSFFKVNAVQCNIASNGNLLTRSGRCLEAAFSAGYIQSDYSSVNLINAAALANNAGVNISTSNSKEKIFNFANSCSIVIKAETKAVSLTGAVVDGKPVLVAIDNRPFSFPLPMSGSFLIFQSSDIASAIGVVTNAGASLASLACTTGDGDKWVAVTTVAALSEDALSRIRIPNIIAVNF
ncbi:D-3-phosphoglycerate dehydrogenase-like [Clavelina lepadiformis]|uniref:D-3-phosphoglycerate dehydrogenase-like n=1 Tax=Clavelina lepadiformis TaxID=159417 RepID=UPI0040413D62